MGPDDIRAFTRAVPFKPFRVRTADGTNYDVHHPYMAMSMPRYLLIGLPDPKSDGEWAAGDVELGWDRVAGVELLASAGATARTPPNSSAG